MLSVPLAPEELEARLGPDLDLGVVNAPELCVASGPAEALDALAARLAEEEIETAKQALYKLHASVVEVHPTSTGRIVVIEKNRAVPKAYPREVGEPKRRPLA